MSMFHILKIINVVIMQSFEVTSASFEAVVIYSIGNHRKKQIILFKFSFLLASMHGCKIYSTCSSPFHNSLYIMKVVLNSMQISGCKVL